MKPLTARPKDPMQRRRVADDLSVAIRTICAAWDQAEWDAASRGYPAGSLGNIGSSWDTSDPTGDAAMRADYADDWLRRARLHTLTLLRLSAESVGRERRWTGPFRPSLLTETLVLCGTDLVELWPVNFGSLVLRFYGLSDQAKKQWPPTPRKGEVVDGVKVGDRGNSVEMCAECGKPIGATAADPLARIDGKPLHRKPCYNTVYVRNRRKAKAS